MSHLIDGHNLIGSGMLPGIGLADPDDEARLLERLQAYRAGGGPEMLVFFDSGDLPGAAGSVAAPRMGSTVSARFARPGETADDAIVAFLEKQRQPGQFTVVTDDSELVRRARFAGANVLSARQFALRLAPRPRRKVVAGEPEPGQKPVLQPNDPAFADIRATFLEAEKAARQRRGRREVRFETWVAHLLEGDPQIAQSAARWLGQSGDEAALEPLRTALVREEPEVRAAAALALGVLDAPGRRAALGELARLLATDDNSMVREAAAQSLGRIGDRSVEPALTEAMSDRRGKVRKAARDALAQIRARR